MFLFGGHLRFGLGRLVALAGEVQHAVDENASEFVVKTCAYHLCVRPHGIQRDKDVAVEGVGGGVVEGDDVGVVVVAQELPVYFQLALVGAEDIVDVPTPKP